MTTTIEGRNFHADEIGDKKIKNAISENEGSHLKEGGRGEGV